MARPWVLANVRPLLAAVIAAGDDSDYRRALELAPFLDAALLAELVAQGHASADPEVREAAADWTADRYHRASKGSRCYCSRNAAKVGATTCGGSWRTMTSDGSPATQRTA